MTRRRRQHLRGLADGKTAIDAALHGGTLRIKQGDGGLLGRVAACFEPAGGGNFPLALPTALPSNGAE